MTFDEIVCNIKNLDECIYEIEEDKSRAFARATKCTAPYNSNDTGKSDSCNNSTELNFQEYSEITKKSDELTDQLIDAKKHLEIIISRIDNPRYRRILKLYYLDGLSKAKISKKLNYCYDYFRKKVFPEALSIARKEVL